MSNISIPSCANGVPSELTSILLFPNIHVLHFSLTDNPALFPQGVFVGGRTLLWLCFFESQLNVSATIDINMWTS